MKKKLFTSLLPVHFQNRFAQKESNKIELTDLLKIK